MKVTPSKIPGVMLFTPQVHSDDRGFLFESFNQKKFDEAVGRHVGFVQDNVSSSKKGVLRGMHFQYPRPQGKLIHVTHGEIYDVVLDIRRGSPTYGVWDVHVLSSEHHDHLWVPEGMAHGFLVLSERADVSYKLTDFFVPEYSHSICWNDPDLSISWPLYQSPILSFKDQNGQLFSEIFK